MAVDRDGDGVVIWDQLSDTEPVGYLFARRFSRTGQLSPIQRVSPQAHWVNDGRIGVRPGGQAVITWTKITDAGYRPFMRTLGSGNRLGAVRAVGRGPDAGAPWVLVEGSGRTTLVWTNAALLARRVASDGSLGRLRIVRRLAHEGELLLPNELGVDRRGVISVACTRWTRSTTFPSDSRMLACLLRISPRLRLMERVRDLTGKRMTIDGAGIGVAPSGAAVVGWQKNYYEGAVVQRVTPNGELGRRVRVADGGLGGIALSGNGDGVVTSTGVAQDGLHRIIRATRVVDGRLRRTVRVGVSDYDTEYLRASALPRGRVLVTWAETQIQVVRGW